MGPLSPEQGKFCSTLLLSWEHSRESSWQPAVIVMNESTGVYLGTYAIVFAN